MTGMNDNVVVAFAGGVVSKEQQSAEDLCLTCLGTNRLSL